MDKSARDELLSEVSAAAEALHEKKDYQNAFVALIAIATRLADRGVRSAFVITQLAIACDYLGRLAEALRYVEEALEMDPVSMSIKLSYDTIIRRARHVLLDKARVVSDPTTPTIYQLLVERGEADLPCHLVMVRFLFESKRVLEASAIVEAVTVLYPGHRPSWELYCSCAEQLGDESRLSRARSGMARCGGTHISNTNGCLAS